MEPTSYFHWTGSPEIFRIGAFAIRWYGVLFALGFIIGYQIMTYIFKKENKPIKELESLVFYVILGTVIGARLGHCLFYEPEYYLSNPLEIIKVWHGGLASHGGAIGVLFALWLFSRKHKKINLLWLLDRIVIPTALVASLIRIGNFFNHEIIGKPTDVPWAIIFNVYQGNQVIGTTPPVHPSQLYESVSYLIIFVLLFLFYKKKILQSPGVPFGLFFFLVFTARFLIEFTKAPQADFEQYLPLSMGQILSIPFVLVGLYFLLRKQRNGT
ncbi:MAG: Prolipoprotein diacylglyceryl transferase [Candidatus Kapaibacterium sp.]|nr:MAG: Prolipoprotein diacylglyceryl transferase [Candidatus Kapabacteria bacterium]